MYYLFLPLLSALNMSRYTEQYMSNTMSSPIYLLSHRNMLFIPPLGIYTTLELLAFISIWTELPFEQYISTTNFLTVYLCASFTRPLRICTSLEQLSCILLQYGILHNRFFFVPLTMMYYYLTTLSDDEDSI